MMNLSNENKLNESMDNSDEMLVLDQPCEYCKVLELDDTQHGGIVQQAENRKRFVQFTSTVNQTWSEYYLSLGYRREDTLPDLPNIAVTAQTCAFCHMLRSDLSFSYKGLQKPRVNGVNGTKHEKEDAKIMITDVNYMFERVGLFSETTWDDDEDDSDWLNLLIVFVEIDWGSKKKEYSLQYRIYADASDPCRDWLRIRRKPISNDFLSARSLSRLHELIGKPLCDASDSAQGTYLPTRLIDVGANNSTNLRLIISNDDEDTREETNPVKKRYVALSYCWGSKEESQKQLKTTADSLSKRLSQIDINEMPQTVADAVLACRALGIRYLWVDALCIIQGDGDDWARESLQVAKVYGSSFLTLCDLQGSSCLGGFLRTKWNRPTLHVKFLSKLDTSISGVVHIRMKGPAVLIPKEWSGNLPDASEPPALFDMKHSPWNSRGWTFQEALLSPRAVFFESQTFSYAFGDWHIFADGSRYPLKDFLPSSKLTPDDPMRGWYRSMEDYSRRRLTYETDKLPAISGLAKLLSEENPDQDYLAGLWISDLHRGLLWSSSTQRNIQDILEPCSQGFKLKHVSQEYIAPSWSWACCPDPVNWIADITSKTPSDTIFRPEYTLLNAEVVAADKSNPYGRVSSACLELDAKLLRAPLHDDGKAKIEAKKSRWFTVASQGLGCVLLSPNDKYIAHFQLDWDFLISKTSDYPNGPTEQMWMVLISSFKDKGLFTDLPLTFDAEEKCFGLLLLPTGNEREFIRVGVWCYDHAENQGKRQWEGIQSQSLKIV